MPEFGDKEYNQKAEGNGQMFKEKGKRQKEKWQE